MFAAMRRLMGSEAAQPQASASTLSNGSMVQGGLEAGRTGRRLRSFNPAPDHVNTLIAASGKTVTARARFLVRNNAYAINAVEAFAAAAVGTGIVPSWRLADKKKRKELHDLWRRWTDEADAEGLTDWYGIQRRVARELKIAGEYFIRLRPRYLSDGLSVPLQLQGLPSEMLDSGYSTTLPGGNVIRQGKEYDRIGRCVAYHFWRTHPGDRTEPQAGNQLRTRIPAAEIIHVLDPTEGGQIRGISGLAQAIVRMWMLDQYDDAELERKKTAAMFVGFISRPDPNTELFDKVAEQKAKEMGEVPEPELEPGTMQVLLPGEEPTFTSPPDTGASYEPFQYRHLLAISAATGVPYSVLTGDRRQANYGSQRGEIVEFRRRIEALQHDVLVFSLCRRVAIAWLDQAVLAGAIDLPGYAGDPVPWREIDWIPPKWDWIDPLKDIAAVKMAVRSGMQTWESAVRANGSDPDETLESVAALNQRMDDAGIVLDTDPRRVTNAGVGQFGNPKDLDDNPKTAD